jgi:hypothetical protein
MTPDPRRKLTIAAGAVAAFIGFVALTGWTSSGEMDEQERREMSTFCSALALSSDYESTLMTAAFAGDQEVLGGGGGLIDAGVSSFIENTLLDAAPERYREDASHLVEGLERALRGQLTPEQASSYAADYQRLEQRATGDCEEFGDEPPDFGGESPFGFGDD